jgi:hypothetical protein
MLKKGHGHRSPHMVMPSGQTHKSHFAIDFTRKSNVLSFNEEILHLAALQFISADKLLDRLYLGPLFLFSRFART